MLMNAQDKLDWAYSIISNALEQTGTIYTGQYCEMSCGQNRKAHGCPWYYENDGHRCYRNDAQHLIDKMEDEDGDE